MNQAGEAALAGTRSHLGTKAVVAWSLGVGGVVVPLHSQGNGGQWGGAIVAAAALLILGCLNLALLSGRQKLWVFVALTGLGEVLSVRFIGRAPMIIAATGTALASAAMLPTGFTTKRGASSTVSRLVVAGLAADALVLLVSRGYAAGSVLLIALAALMAGQQWRPQHLAPIERRLGPLSAAAEKAVSAVRRRVAATTRAVGSGLGTSARAAIRAGASALSAWRHMCAGTRGWVVSRANRPIITTGVIISLLSGPIFWRLVVDPSVLIRGTNDINSGLPRIRWIRFWPFRMSVAHPVWFVVIRGLSSITGEVAAVTLVGALSTGAAAAVLITMCRSKWDRTPAVGWPLAVGVGLGYMFLESPALLLSRSGNLWGRYTEASHLARGTGYFPLHQWGTPTIVMSLPFAFLLLAWLLRVLDEVEDPLAPRGGWHRRSLGVLTVFISLLQPATTLALIPAVPIYLIVSRRWSLASVKAVGRWFVLPGGAVCLAQVWFLASNVSPYERATWLWRPFWSWHYFGLDRPVFWSMLILPILCLTSGRIRYLRQPAVAVSLIGLVVSMVPFLLLEQTTVALVHDGDLGVPPLMAGILLFTASLRFLAIEFQSLWNRQHEPAFKLPRWTFAVGLVLAIMFCAGVLDFLAASGFITEF